MMDNEYIREIETENADAVHAASAETAQTDAPGQEAVPAAVQAEAAEQQDADSPGGRPRRAGSRRSFLLGLAAGAALTLLAAFLYRGYIYFPAGSNGYLMIKFPYYEKLHGPQSGRFDRVEVERKMTEIENLIDRSYMYEVDPAFMEDGIMTGMIYGLTDTDKYAAYYSANNYKEETKKNQGSYVGIGITATKDMETGGVRVENVAQGGPAAEAGLQAGDAITEANGTDLTELTLDEAVDLITGAEGTDVTLHIVRGDYDFDVTVTRKTIKDISVRREIIPGTNIGYISVSAFTNATENDFYEAVDHLTQEKEAIGLVIDLRNNGGGDMNVALNMADSLLKDDINTFNSGIYHPGQDKNANGRTLLLSARDKNGKADYYYAGDGWSLDVPVAVVVNGKSASASEIVAGILMDYGSPVVGEKTFGKGIVQSLYTLSDKSAVKFTTDKYILPDGSQIHEVGITPTIPVPFEEYDGITENKVNHAGDAEEDITKDVQIKAAVEAIRDALFSGK